MRITAKVEGNRKAAEQVKEFHYQDRRKVSATVREGLNDVLKLARFYCPVDKGPLRDSGRVIMELHALVGEVKFGDKYSPYCIWVHEDLSKHHDAPTRAKWLEIAMRELEGRNAKKLGAALKAAFKGR